MRYERDFKNIQLTENTVLSMGKFDGLHRGHKLLLDSVFEKKEKHGLKAAIFTFDMPPGNLISAAGRQVITTNEEKQALLQECGTDYFVECPFTEEIMHMEPEQFIRQIALRLRVKWLVVGTDFRFGHKRRGDYHMLQDYAGEYGYQLRVVQKMQYEGRDISSTYIREEIQKGHIELANQLLGYPYFIKGNIIRGNQLGRRIGFPTVNILPPEQKFLPPFGVYISRITMEGQCYDGITNIGRKPTIHGAHGQNPVGVETYIYDFHGDLYGKEAKISILHFERPERTFAGIDELKQQLQKDIRCGREYFLEQRSVNA